jgi:BirA family biotin operon repressor/biotin-[acetyl-CoA-carboxylase] ligase
MDFPFARATAPLLRVVDSIGSTNAELAALQRRVPQPHGTALLTLDQTDGRGRLGRSWVAPAGSALAVSIVISTDLAVESLPWLPIIGGLAARDAVAAELPGSSVAVKWPNDVLVVGADGVERKIVGVLAEFVAPSAVVLGVGVNTGMQRGALPVATATSIALEQPVEGVDRAGLDDRVAAAVLGGILGRVSALVDAAGDVERSGLGAEVRHRCGTIGRRVRVDLPAGMPLVGRGAGLDPTGALIVEGDGGGTAVVHAGDVTHLRYE